MKNIILVWISSVIACAALVFILAISAGFLQHWIAIHSGTDTLMCGHAACIEQPYTDWWAGAGSDLGELTLVSVAAGSVATYYRVHECHNKTCHWPAHHTNKDGHRLCKKCIGKPLSALELHEIHPDHVA